MSRHLVLVDKAIGKTERRALKHRRKPDVDIVSVETLEDVCSLTDAKRDELRQLYPTFGTWETVSMIFDGNYDEDAQSISVIGVKLRVDVHDDRFKTGAKYGKFKTVIDHLSAMVSSNPAVVHRGIYIYASKLGGVPGVQQLLKENVPQVYLSTNATGSDHDADWEVEWGNKDWYVLTSDQREHAKRHLFSKLGRLSLEVG